MPDVILAAMTVYTANTPLEWWCINWHFNNNAFPIVSRLVVKANNSASVPVDKNVLFVRGKFKLLVLSTQAPAKLHLATLLQ